MTIDWDYYNEPCHRDAYNEREMHHQRAVVVVQEMRDTQLAAQRAGVTYEQLPIPIMEGASVPLGLPVRATGDAPAEDVEAWEKVTAQRVIVEEPDMVRQPSHYARYVIEPVTFILANKLAYDVGNVVKYVCRYDAKNGLEDLEKAKRYVEIVIERVKREARVANGERAQAVWSEII